MFTTTMTTTQLVLYTGWSESWRGCCEIAFVLWLYHLTVLWQLTVFCLLKFSCIVSNNSVYQAFSISDSMAWNSLPFFVWDPVSRTDYFGRLCKTYILVRATLLHPAHDGFLTIHTHTRLMALFPGLPGSAGTWKVKPIWILLKRDSEWQWPDALPATQPTASKHWRQINDNHTHTYIHLTALFLRLPRWASTKKVKPIWILLKQETVSGSGISWAICKSASRSRQITTPVTHHSVFYRPDALPAAQPTVSKYWRQWTIMLYINLHSLTHMLTRATLDSALLLVAGMYPCTTLDHINFGSTFCRIIVTFTKFFHHFWSDDGKNHNMMRGFAVHATTFCGILPLLGYVIWKGCAAAVLLALLCLCCLLVFCN